MERGDLTRRGVVRLIALSATAAGLGHRTVGRARATEANWHQHRHDARNTGDASGHDVPSAGLVEDWRYETEGAGHPPSVVDGVAYVPDGAGIHALATAGGSRLWSAPIGTVVSPPAVAGGTVFALTEAGTVHAIDTENAREEWRSDVGGNNRSLSPTVVGDRLYVGGDRLYALSTDDGSEAWRFETAGRVSSSPAVVDGTVYAGDFSGRAYAVDAADGSEEWTAKLPDGHVTTPAVVDGTVFFGDFDRGDVYALSAADGSPQWRAPTGDLATSPAVADGVVYVKGGEDLLAFSADDGEELWRTGIPGGWSSPVVADDTVYVGGRLRLYAVGTENGEIVDSFRGETRDFRTPVAVDGTVYASTYSGRLFALTGGIKARISGPSEVTWGRTGTFSAERSVSAGESIVRYEWVIDGLTGSSDDGVRTSHTFFASGAPDVALRVVDTAGRTARTTSSVDVRKAGLYGGLTGLAGLTGVGTVGIAVRRLRGGDDGTGGTETGGDPDGGTATDAGSGDTADDEAIAKFLDTADAAVSDAEEHRSQGEYDAALNRYDDALDQYATALDVLPEDDDRREGVQSDRERVASTRNALDSRQEAYTSLVGRLREAESHFQTAIAAPTSEKVVIARERYRQAGEAYERALELYDDLDDPPTGITVSPDVDVVSPPERLAQFPGMTPAALAALEELGVENRSALREADEGTLEELRTVEAIPDRLETRLVAIHHWAADGNVVFDGRDDIERRARLAEEGYRVHR